MIKKHLIWLFLIPCLIAYWFFVPIFKNEVVIKRNENIKTVYKNSKIKYTIFDLALFKTFDLAGYKLNVGKFKIENKNKINRVELIKLSYFTKPKTIKLTITEGMTQDKVFKKLEDLKLTTKEKIKKYLKTVDFYYPHNDVFEGYFLPNTYIFYETDDEKIIVDIILKEFLKNFKPENYKDKESFYNNLILSSIVQAEIANNDEIDKIAGIFKHRLEIGMKLQSDATLRYVLDNNRQAYRNELLTSKSKYNTYYIYGLTESPINNPSKDAILKTLNAKVSEYLYFYHKNKKTYYAKTHEEHLKNRNRND